MEDLKETSASLKRKREEEEEIKELKPKIFIILLGPPGSGKGTQSQLLLEKYNVVHISSGDLLRRERNADTPRGKFVSNKNWNFQDLSEVGNELIEEALAKVAQEEKGYILDGVPKTLSGILTLHQLLKKFKLPLDYVIELQCSSKILEDRMKSGKRLVHSSSGRVYHTKLRPPKIENQDDITGEPLEERNDDIGENKIVERIKAFKKTTYPVITYYQNMNLVYSFSSDQTAESLNEQICQVLDKKIQERKSSKQIKTEVQNGISLFDNPFFQIEEEFGFVLKRNSVMECTSIREKLRNFLPNVSSYDGFPGQKEAALTLKNFQKLIDHTNDYQVSPKLDGIRNLLYLDQEKMYFVDRNLKIVQLLDGAYPETLNQTLLDGELIKPKATSKSELPLHFVIFDCLIFHGEIITQQVFQKRIEQVQKIVPQLSSKTFLFQTQKYFPLSDIEKAFQSSDQYHLDGLVFSPKGVYISGLNQDCLKWKPLEHITADFIIQPDKFQPEKYSTFVTDSKGKGLKHYGWIIPENWNKDIFPQLCGYVVECKYDKNWKSEFWDNRQKKYVSTKGGWIVSKIRSDRSTPNVDWVVESLEKYLNKPIEKDYLINLFSKK